MFTINDPIEIFVAERSYYDRQLKTTVTVPKALVIRPAGNSNPKCENVFYDLAGPKCRAILSLLSLSKREQNQIIPYAVKEGVKTERSNGTPKVEQPAPKGLSFNS